MSGLPYKAKTIIDFTQDKSSHDKIMLFNLEEKSIVKADKDGNEYLYNGDLEFSIINGSVSNMFVFKVEEENDIMKLYCVCCDQRESKL